MRTDEFDYPLPPELIAQSPAPKRDQSRLLVLPRLSGQIAHRRFPDLLEYLRPGDVMVMNNSRVFPARLRGRKADSGGNIEVLLLEECAVNDWWVMLRPGKRVRIGTGIIFEKAPALSVSLRAVVGEKNNEGHCRLQFSGVGNIVDVLDTIGEIPLPPYITRTGNASTIDDRERYQTVYAQSSGSVAAPTAGLHFTPALLEQIRALGVHLHWVTLHVGLGTFAPVKAETLGQHIMHEERFSIGPDTAEAIMAAKREHRRVIAVGTTTVRVLESVAASNNSQIVAMTGRTRIFIYPPYVFKVVDALLTNFHLPKSTLLMLASAFAAPGEMRGRELMLSAYAEAVRERYRFFSYGDAMLLL